MLAGFPAIMPGTFHVDRRGSNWRASKPNSPANPNNPSHPKLFRPTLDSGPVTSSEPGPVPPTAAALLDSELRLVLAIHAVPPSSGVEGSIPESIGREPPKLVVCEFTPASVCEKAVKELATARLDQKSTFAFGTRFITLFSNSSTRRKFGRVLQLCTWANAPSKTQHRRNLRPQKP